LLSVDEAMFDKSGNLIGTLTECGNVDDGEEVLSIHKISAKVRGIPANNGWDYFYIKRNGELKAIDELRYEFAGR
jgi:site-specific DNA-methyltransferase (adenine-specific)